MSFEKSNKLGKGRIPGSTNRVDTQLRNFVNGFLLDNKDDLKAAWDELTPFQKVTSFKDLIRYVLPVMSSVEQVSDVERLPTDQLDLIIENLKNVKANGKAKTVDHVELPK